MVAPPHKDSFKYLLAPSKCAKRYVVHRHDAIRAGLHYDLRLEAPFERKGCVLLSWTTRKWPDFVSHKLDKIMLIATDVHEMSWLKFEGEIKSGYGEGIVEIFDTGVYNIVSTSDKAIVIELVSNREHPPFKFALVKAPLGKEEKAETLLAVRVKHTKEQNFATALTPYATPYARGGYLCLLQNTKSKKKERRKRC
jgi:hypothetical protein